MFQPFRLVPEYRSCLNIYASLRNKTGIVKMAFVPDVFTAREALQEAVDYTDRVVVSLSTLLP